MGYNFGIVLRGFKKLGGKTKTIEEGSEYYGQDI